MNEIDFARPGMFLTDVGIIAAIAGWFGAVIFSDEYRELCS